MPKNILVGIMFLSGFCNAQGQHPIPFESEELNASGDLSEQMVAGIHQFFLKKLSALPAERMKALNNASPEEDGDAVASRLARIGNHIGLPTQRADPKMHLVTDDNLKPIMQMVNGIETKAIRWEVGGGVEAEGILLSPASEVKMRVILLPDADILPESFAGILDDGRDWVGIGNRLATSGCEVIIPTLIDRDDRYSGSDEVGRYTNQPHREWLYRQGYEMGRHIIGDEVSKVLCAVDWFAEKNETQDMSVPIGVLGYGEGGLLAMYLGLLDDRIETTLISGYIDAREHVWEEPIYRNVWDLLSDFGDAELLALFGNRKVIVEHSAFPEVEGPPEPGEGRRGAAPGFLHTPAIKIVEDELARIEKLSPNRSMPKLINAFEDGNGMPFCALALNEFGKAFGLEIERAAWKKNVVSTQWLDVEKRQERQVRNLEEVYQDFVFDCEKKRDQEFWSALGDLEGQKTTKSKLREDMWEVLGRLPDPSMPVNPRARFVEETDQWTRYEVVLDVWEDVFAWGLLTVPKNILAGEMRPVIVCQHGLEGLPEDCVITDPNYPKYKAYKGFATRLAEEGFITFAPHNPYRGFDKFRVLQRMANPMGYSIFSVIIGQHQRILEWLKGLRFVDPDQIAFYGLSYGGKTALRVPAILEDYCLSICSGDFNEWIRKNVSTRLKYSYMFSPEYEMPEWNLGQTFNHAEMAALIAPRPFMVEFGYQDGIGSVEWVSYEFGKVRRHYDLIEKPDLAELELFDGPHSINGKGTYGFLDRLLNKN